MDYYYGGLQVPWPNEREEVLQWIQRGRDPFRESPPGIETPFDQASESRDLELLLHMVAEPGTAWTKRFLFCRNSEVEVPVKGRACIPSLGSNLLYSFHGFSMEGLEVLMMYGYKLEKYDINTLCGRFVITAEISRPNYTILKMVKFCLATTTAGSNLATRDSPSDMMCKTDLEILFFFIATVRTGTIQLARLELARVLLKAGVSPMPPLPFSEEPWESVPPVFSANRNRHIYMVKLLIAFGGAELPSSVRVVRWNTDQNMDEVLVDISQLSLAEEDGMLDLLLDRPATPVVVNASEYIQQLRLEITKPLRLAISEIIVVTFLRGTGQPPPMGVLSYSILSFCKFLDYDWTAASPHLRQTS
jgi:hypothetical protein